METFGTPNNIYLGKLANFSQITEMSLFGKHEMLDYKIVTDLIYMQTRKHLLSRNSCNVSSSLENVAICSCDFFHLEEK